MLAIDGGACKFLKEWANRTRSAAWGLYPVVFGTSAAPAMQSSPDHRNVSISLVAKISDYPPRIITATKLLLTQVMVVNKAASEGPSGTKGPNPVPNGVKLIKPDKKFLACHMVVLRKLQAFVFPGKALKGAALPSPRVKEEVPLME